MDQRLLPEVEIQQIIAGMPGAETEPNLWCNGRLGLAGTRAFLGKSCGRQDPPLPLMCCAQLHNRRELLQLLGFGSKQLINDEELLFACYRKWGTGFADKVLGEWVAALWDEERQQLVIATSHYWGPQIYYCQTPSAFYFATNLSTLLAHGPVPKRLNEFRLGQLLIGWNDHLGDTIYQDLHILGPARVLTLSADNLTIERYWVLEERPQIQLASDEEYAEAFLDIYRDAVRCRLNSPNSVGATLSGGIDSGSVAALAAEQLRKTEHTLPTFTSIPLHACGDFALPGRFGDEMDCATATAQHAGNMSINWIRSEQRSPLQAIKEVVSLLAEPPVTAANHYWILSMLEAAQAKGVATLLIGQLGNASVSWKGFPPARFNLAAFKKDLSPQGQKSSRDMLRVIKRHLLFALMPESICGLRWRSVPMPLNWRAYSPINDCFAIEQRFEEKMRAMGRLFPHEARRDARRARLQLVKPVTAPACMLWTELGRRYGIWVSDPTADKRLLEFSLALPNDQFYRDGEEKYLAKRALANILPRQVLHNRKRGQQAADLQQRLLAEEAEIEQLICEFHRSELCHRYLDVAKIKSSLSALTHNTHKGFIDTTNILAKGLLFGLFLQKLERGSRIELQ